MPRVSQEKAAQTRQKIIQAALRILIEQGEGALTFTNIAKEVGIARSGINGHFRKKSDLIDTIRPQISEIIIQQLDFTSANHFYDSWVHAIKTSLKFRNTISHAKIVFSTAAGINGLKELLEGDDEAERYILMAIGYAVVYLPEYD